MPPLHRRRDGRSRLVRMGLRELGWAMIALGVVVLLLAAYLVIGTRTLEERSQATLRRGFEAAIADHARVVAARGVHHRERLEESHWVSSDVVGGAIDELTIPAIGLDTFVVNGVSEQDLMLGPGHYPGTALPGQFGNVAIAGHRTTYGAPFYALDALRMGERILVTSRIGRRYLYRVSRAPFVVPPSDTAVLAPTSTAELTLTTCTPRYWATSRLVVVARLVNPPPAPRPGSAREAIAVIPVMPVSPNPFAQALWLWAVLVAVLWLAIRAAARHCTGVARLVVVGGAIGAAMVVLWFAFASVVGTLPSLS
jgi:sortase A